VDFATPANSLLRTCYPTVGGTADSHKYNLINPVDSDAAYRLHYVDTITHDAKGMTGDGDSGIVDTHLNGRSVLPESSHGADVFCNYAPANAGYPFDLGAYISAIDQLLIGCSVINSNIYIKDKADSLTKDSAINGTISGTGLSQINKLNNNAGGVVASRNYNLETTTTGVSSGTIPNSTIKLLGITGQATWFSNRTISYVGLRSAGLSAPAMALYRAAIYQLQADLNRMPPMNIIFEGHSLMLGNTTTTVTDKLYHKVVTGLKGIYSHRLFDYKNNAVSGSSTAEMITRKSTNVDPFYHNLDKLKNVIIIWSGTNEFSGTTGQGVTVFNYLNSYVNSCIADGWIPIVLTMTNKKSNYSEPELSIVESERVIFNNLIKGSMSASAKYLDLDLNAELLDSANATYYNADKVHLIGAGNAVVNTALLTLIQTL
jgi:hypothetical protein